MATTKNFSIQGSMDVAFFGLETNQLEAYLEDCLTTNVELTAEKVYVLGKGGSIIKGYSHSRRIPVTIKQGYPTAEILAIQSGQDVVIGENTNVMKFERLTVNSDTATTNYIALGDVGQEIGSIWTMSGKSFDTKLEQAGTVAPGKFSYTSGTRLLTFNTGELAENTVIMVAYRYTADATAETFKFDTDVFSKAYKVVMTGIAVDNCTDKAYKAQLIFRKMDVEDGFTIALDDTGDPCVIDMNLNAASSCESNTLMEWVIFDEDLAV
ncbi:MAG: hypothetical protein B6I18_06875 [Bacteroidetes bacterium 4572_112]|nr:MAG: hypothetical protein B6I18_06875 [Bacteroidetes bacterium 4572_112]